MFWSSGKKNCRVRSSFHNDFYATKTQLTVLICIIICYKPKGNIITLLSPLELKSDFISIETPWLLVSRVLCPPTKAMLLWLGSYICLFLSGHLSVYISVYISMSVVGFQARFHSGHLAPSEVSCLKRQTTLRWPHLIFVMIQWPPIWFNGKRNIYAHCILENSRKTHATIANVFSSIAIEIIYICSLLKVWHKCNGDR